MEARLKYYVACLQNQMLQPSQAASKSSQSKNDRQLELPDQDSNRVEQLMSRCAFSKIPG
jgi:hypothetical protein